MIVIGKNDITDNRMNSIILVIGASLSEPTQAILHLPPLCVIKTNMVQSLSSYNQFQGIDHTTLYKDMYMYIRLKGTYKE